MKKIIFILFALIFLYSPAFAQTVSMPYLENSQPYLPTTTLLNAVTATGTGTSTPIGLPFTKFTCVTTWGGTVPTNTVVNLEGSIDNSTWVTLSTTTVTSSPTVVTTTGGHSVLYIRGNYVSKAVGDATTSVTLKCVAVYN